MWTTEVRVPGRLLLAVDRSADARMAVGAAGTLARALPAEVMVLHVHETPLTAALYDRQALEGAGIESADGTRSLVDRTVSSLRRLDVVASGSVRPARTTTAAEIVGAADELHVDLVLVGARGLGRWRGLLLGSVARAVVQLAPCPVLVVRRRRAFDPRRMLLAADGSAGATRAASVCAALAERLDASVLVVHATDGSTEKHEPDAIAAAAAAAVGRGRVMAVRVRAAGQAGIAAALCEEAIEYSAGMIVVGRRGLSALSRLVLGGVSERLLGVAPCAVLVVPEPAALAAPARAHDVASTSSGEP
jgi:nucleotide-binding universal stress UspA family protein